MTPKRPPADTAPLGVFDDGGPALLRASSRSALAARAATSPPAVEATLASISDEVMQDAIARRGRAAKSRA